MKFIFAVIALVVAVEANPWGSGGLSGYPKWDSHGDTSSSGRDGLSGLSGHSGHSGYSGHSGNSGHSGHSGRSGLSGISGLSGGSELSPVPRLLGGYGNPFDWFPEQPGGDFIPGGWNSADWVCRNKLTGDVIITSPDGTVIWPDVGWTRPTQQTPRPTPPQTTATPTSTSATTEDDTTTPTPTTVRSRPGRRGGVGLIDVRLGN